MCVATGIAPLPAELNKVFELARELDGKAEGASFCSAVPPSRQPVQHVLQRAFGQP